MQQILKVKKQQQKIMHNKTDLKLKKVNTKIT